MKNQDGSLMARPKSATHYVVEEVGSMSTMVMERLRDTGLELSEACYDLTMERDAIALA